MSKWGCNFAVDLGLGEGDVLDILGRCAVLECWIVELGWGDVRLMWYGWLLKVYGEAGV